MSIPTFQNLPTEILITLFGYIHSRDLWKNVRSVNQRFNDILTQDSYWLTRIKHKKHLRLSRRQKTTEFCSLPERCTAIEDDFWRWKSNSGLKKCRSCSQHYATIDVVKLHRTIGRKNLCFSASRDHSIVLWDLEKVARNVNERECTIAKIEEAHSGWIFGLTCQDDEVIYTSSWDGSVKQWQLRDSTFQCTNRHQTTEAVLSCVMDKNRIYCSSYGGKILAFDPRTSFEPVHFSQARRRAPIISLDCELNSNYLHLANEAGRISYLDVRNIRADMNPVKENKLASTLSSICLAEGTLACCLGNGRIQYIHPTSLRKEADFFVSGEGKRVWSCALTPGATVAVTNDYFVKVFSPGMDPKLMASIEISGRPSKVSYLNGNLVAAAGDGSVCFWLKNQEFEV